jgi:subtilase family serine protease
MEHRDPRFCPEVCLAIVPKKGAATPLCVAAACGWTPSQLETAYGLNSSLGNGTGTVVAVVEAGDDPDAASTLAYYRSTFGLSAGTMYKYNEEGQQYNYPESCEDYGWCLETDLDIEMVSSACPNCTIALMEANSYEAPDFEATEAEAVSIGATIISNSWSYEGSWDGSNYGGGTNFPTYFDTPGITYLASSGDSGYGKIGAPSVLDSVIAVGGTQLHLSGSTYSQTIWNDQYGAAGAGCSSTGEVGSPGVPKPSWQHDPDCANRTDADVSAEAGLEPGVAVYTGIYGQWYEVGGTSVASPFTAGVIALAGNASSQNGGENFWDLKKKKQKTELYVIKSGNDGSCSDPLTYLCAAGLKGKYKYRTYSGPGGWGTPLGIAAY